MQFRRGFKPIDYVRDHAMAYREDMLRDKTFKGNEEGIERRVFNALTCDPSVESHRVAKLVSLLVAHLANKGELAEENLDEILMEVIH